MDFGRALQILKDGGRVAREGWNGKGMWIALMPGYPDGVPANEHAARAMNVSTGANIVVRPYIAMRDAQATLVPWLASQTDILAEDWITVSV